MEEKNLDKTKTGAVICKKSIPGTDQLEYAALIFITEIPLHVTDEQLKNFLDLSLKNIDTKDCREMIIRADINSTSNEVWEQFKHLNSDAGKAQVILFENIR